MAEGGVEYANRFGGVFEKHVVDQLHALPWDVFDETQLKTFLPDGAGVTDGAIAEGTYNVFVEAKSGLYGESVLTVGSSEYWPTKRARYGPQFRRGGRCAKVFDTASRAHQRR
jgi:hypothetical protein